MSLQYPNAPFREAICEFRYKQDGKWDGAAPGLVYSAMSHEFPRRLADDSPPPTSDQQVGSIELVQVGPQQLQLQIAPQRPFRFWRENDDSGYIAVAPYRLSVHHSRPYPSWVRFREIIGKGAQAYQEILEPIEVQRIGLRYINHIDLGPGSVSIEDFFDFYPFVGSDIPQRLSRFHCMVQMDFEDARDSLTLQIMTAMQSDGQSSGVILDLDYFLAQPSKLELADSGNWLETAHDHLKRVFEGCLKDSLRDSFL